MPIKNIFTPYILSADIGGSHITAGICNCKTNETISESQIISSPSWTGTYPWIDKKIEFTASFWPGYFKRRKVLMHFMPVQCCC